MSGRKRKPTALRSVTGNRAHKRRNKSEPTYRAADPVGDHPEWLIPDAVKEWDRIALVLAEIGLLPVTAIQALGAYCQCYAQWIELQGRIRNDGWTLEIRDDKGALKSVIRNPDVTIADSLLKQVRQWAGEFGLTPASGAKIELDKIPAETLPDETIDEEIRRLCAELEIEAAGGATGREIQ